MQANKAVVGANAFSHSAGVHQDGVLKARDTYEIIDPLEVGATESEIILSARSGHAALRHRLVELGYEFDDSEFDDVYQRFLEIARALATDPKIILLDEPAAGMTNQEMEHLDELLDKFRKKNLAVVIIEHHTSLVKSVSDDLTVLNFGKQIADGDPDTVLSDPEVIRAYLGGDIIEQ